MDVEMQKEDLEATGEAAQEAFDQALSAMPDAPAEGEPMPIATEAEAKEMIEENSEPVAAAADTPVGATSDAPKGGGEKAEAKAEPKKINVAQALSDFNSEYFWQAFYHECNRLIAEGRSPKLFVVPWDRADKLLLSAIRAFKDVDVKTKSAEELIFNFDEKMPPNAPEGFQPKRHSVRVMISRCLPSNPRYDVALLV